MKKYKIALLPGDGVGKEVIKCAYMVLNELGINAEYTFCDIGWEFWKGEGEALPERTIDILKQSDCALLGAITSKTKFEAEEELCNELKNKNLHYISPIIKLRQLFDLGINFRPCKSFKGNILNHRDNIDITIFRENTEGLYCGIEYYPFPEELYNLVKKDHEKISKYYDIGLEKTAVSFRIMSEPKCENIIRAAFEFAKANNKGFVTVVDKPNILRETGGLFITVARKISKDYPNIKLLEVNIDALCMWLIKNPENYEVIVAENLFGDIISDLAAQLVGGMGFACSGNIGENFAVFEPTHGSAPKYSGMNKVNPIATILAAAYMLEWLGEKSKSKTLINAIIEIISEGKYGTYDMGLNNTNIEFTNQIILKLKEAGEKNEKGEIK